MGASSSRRYLSVWLRRLATDRIARRSLMRAETPLVLFAPVKSALRIAALNDAAARLKLRTGMALADARAMYPSLMVMDADPTADHALLEAIADWCDRYTPLVGLDPPDGLVFDITGCVHLFGGEAPLCRDIVTRLSAQGFAVRVAVADTVGCAWGVARYGDFSSPSEEISSPSPLPAGLRPATSPLQGEVKISFFSLSPYGGGNDGALSGITAPSPRQRGEGEEVFRVVPSSETRAALVPLPVVALRLAQETVEALTHVGLKHVGDVLDKPRAPLAARFGSDFVRRLDQALGLEDEPITPCLPVPSYVTERRFAEPIALERDVLATIEHLANELSHILERRGEGARQLQAAFFRTDGKVLRIEVGTSAPLRDPARIRRLFAERLAVLGDECDPGFGFDVVRLSALVAERLDPAQTGLASDTADLAHLIDRLGARFGLRRVTRLVPQDTHIPEFAVAAVPASEAFAMRGEITRPPRSGGEGRREAFSSPSPLWGGLSHMPGGTAVDSPPPCGEGSGVGMTQSRSAAPCSNKLPSPPSPTRGEGAEITQDTLAPARPLRLFARPERVEAVAEVPDGPPVRFRWRRMLHEVAHAEGPERIAMEWWRDEAGARLTRDYFRIESRDGLRAWLYREGFYGDAASNPRWFLHGLFA